MPKVIQVPVVKLVLQVSLGNKVSRVQLVTPDHLELLDEQEEQVWQILLCGHVV